MFAPTALACRPVCTVEISADCVVNSLLFLLRARKLCCKCHAPCVAERYLRLEHNHETRIRDRVAAGNMLFQDCNRSRISDQFCNRGERRKAVGIDAFDFNGTAQCDITAGCTGKDLIFAGLCGPLLLLNIIAGKVLLTQFKCDSLLLAGLQEYSKFEISDLTLDHTVVNYDNEETLTASVKVRNVSDRAGKEVVQIYISDVKSTLDKPVKELKAFRKVLLQPSEEQVLTFQITKDMLKSYDPEHKCWDCEAGYYEVLAGNASDNISCKAKFLVKCRSIYNYNEKTMLCVIHADERAAKIIDAQLEALHIDVSDMADALYYFPHREIGQVLHSMLDHAPIDEAVKKQAYEQIFEAVGALDISEL